MIEVKTQFHVYRFDGHIVEIFEGGGEGKRYHPALINSIEVEDRGRRGKRLKIETISSMGIYAIEDDIASEMQVLVSAVQAVMS